MACIGIVSLPVVVAAVVCTVENGHINDKGRLRLSCLIDKNTPRSESKPDVLEYRFLGRGIGAWIDASNSYWESIFDRIIAIPPCLLDSNVVLELDHVDVRSIAARNCSLTQ